MSDNENALLQMKETAWTNTPSDHFVPPVCSCKQLSWAVTHADSVESFSYITMDKMCDLINWTLYYHYCSETGSLLGFSSTTAYLVSKNHNKHKQQQSLAVLWIK